MTIIRRGNVFDSLGEFHFGSNSLSHPRSSICGKISNFAEVCFDWKETSEAHVFKADLPGLKKEEVKVEVEEQGRWLWISGEKKRETEEKGIIWHHMERSSVNFQRHFRLPENAKVDGVRAAMENGVLTVTVPKEEVKKVGVMSIEISG
ncbi:18.1 kDa class I heat shock protein-like [Dendrobium catenatum]|uniref:18.1 kDa class I heat shock protein n=1 Tax=Dendrobium catenatum TaxID=906689 RepID=A0A2I0X717_9ASPA|nr:18.1 kDa class I heat shock protein-like [Dendrobium catenatum]PKU83707.1 18.1 kDa class I heat shock protein [Dendrobium catenatum]